MYSNNIDTNMYVLFSKPRNFYNQMSLTPVFLLQMWHKTIYEWLLSTENIHVVHLNVKLFFLDQKPYFSKANNWKRKKSFFSEQIKSTRHIFLSLFSEQFVRWLIHVPFANFVCLGNPIIHYLNLLINFFLNFDSDNVIRGRNVCVFDFN